MQQLQPLLGITNSAVGYLALSLACHVPQYLYCMAVHPTIPALYGVCALHRYPALQWQQRAARRAVHRVAVAGGWLRERVALTRYAHVPLASLGGDPVMAIADILYARNLRDSGHLLWIKDHALPDPGNSTIQ